MEEETRSAVAGEIMQRITDQDFFNAIVNDLEGSIGLDKLDIIVALAQAANVCSKALNAWVQDERRGA